MQEFINNLIDFHKFMKMREIKIFLKKMKIKGWNMKKNTIFALRFLIKNVSKSKGSEKVIKKNI